MQIYANDWGSIEGLAVASCLRALEREWTQGINISICNRRSMGEGALSWTMQTLTAGPLTTLPSYQHSDCLYRIFPLDGHVSCAEPETPLSPIITWLMTDAARFYPLQLLSSTSGGPSSVSVFKPFKIWLFTLLKEIRGLIIIYQVLWWDGEAKRNGADGILEVKSSKLSNYNRFDKEVFAPRLEF